MNNFSFVLHDSRALTRFPGRQLGKSPLTKTISTYSYQIDLIHEQEGSFRLTLLGLVILRNATGANWHRLKDSLSNSEVMPILSCVVISGSDETFRSFNPFEALNLFRIPSFFGTLGIFQTPFSNGACQTRDKVHRRLITVYRTLVTSFWFVRELKLSFEVSRCLFFAAQWDDSHFADQPIHRL